MIYMNSYYFQATTGEEPSLHITITVPTSDYCWGVQLTKHLMQKLQSKELSWPLSRCITLYYISLYYIILCCIIVY